MSVTRHRGVEYVIPPRQALMYIMKDPIVVGWVELDCDWSWDEIQLGA